VEDLLKKLRPLHRAEACPFADLPNSRSDRRGGGVTAEEMRKMQWVRPEVVVQVRFVEWTAEGRLRHAAFVGWATGEPAVCAATSSRQRSHVESASTHGSQNEVDLQAE
jgi:ATP-dependent DNA ligase